MAYSCGCLRRYLVEGNRGFIKEVRMKKINKALITASLALMVVAGFSSCGSKKEVAAYKGDVADKIILGSKQLLKDMRK